MQRAIVDGQKRHFNLIWKLDKTTKSKKTTYVCMVYGI